MTRETDKYQEKATKGQGQISFIMSSMQGVEERDPRNQLERQSKEDDGRDGRGWMEGNRTLSQNNLSTPLPDINLKAI